MTERDERIAYAQMTLTDGIERFATIIWTSNITDLYGVGVPYLNPYEERFAVAVDIERILDQTEFLAEPEFHDHLLWLRARAGLQVVFHDDPDRDVEVDRCLNGIAPGSHQRALGLVTGGA